MSDLKKLKKLAENATPGPWATLHVKTIHPTVWQKLSPQYADKTLLEAELNENGNSNCAFIAAFNPTVALSLIKKLEVAIEALKFYSADEHFMFDSAQSEKDECDKEIEPDTISGEPQNFFCGHGDFTYENGAIARQALKEIEGD